MLKKIAILALKFFGFILFMITVLSLGPLKIYFDINHITYYLILGLSPIFTLPLVYSRYPGSRFKKVSLHFLVFGGTLLFLDVSTDLLRRNRGIHQFSYQAGNVLGPLRVLIQNKPGQFILKKTFSILPYSTQYILYALEDSIRTIEMKEMIDSTDNSCPQITKYECFKKVYLVANTDAPLNTTGQILSVAIGTALINIEKGKDKSPKNSIEALLRIYEITNFVSKSLNHEARVENQIPNFPKNELNALPNEIISKLDILAPKYNKVSWRIIFGITPKTDLPLEENIAEAYFLQKLEYEIVQKFKQSISATLNGIKAEVEKKLENKSFEGKLSKQEILEYQKRLKDISII